MDNLLSHVRRKKNIKQNDMAKAVDVSPSYLCKVEKGLQKPSRKFKQACARFLNVSVNVLFPEKHADEKIQKINQGFKNKLWSIRKERKMKQYELARLLKCSPSYLSKVEKGLQDPTDKFKKNCAKILKIKEVEIFS